MPPFLPSSLAWPRSFHPPQLAPTLFLLAFVGADWWGVHRLSPQDVLLGYIVFAKNWIWMLLGAACTLWFTLLPPTYYTLCPFPRLACWPPMEIESALPAASCLPCSSLSGLKTCTRLSKPNAKAPLAHVHYFSLSFPRASPLPHQPCVSLRLSDLLTFVSLSPQDRSSPNSPISDS